MKGFSEVAGDYDVRLKTVMALHLIICVTFTYLTILALVAQTSEKVHLNQKIASTKDTVHSLYALAPVSWLELKLSLILSLLHYNLTYKHL